MQRHAQTLACLMLCLLLGACGTSPRNDYYRLTANVKSEPAGESPSLGIGPVEIPAYLDREKLVYGKSGNQVQIASSENWAEPLEAGVTRVVALNLAGLLDTQNVRTFPWHPRRAPDYAVKVTVLSLDANNSEAILTAEWLVYDPDGSKTVERRITRLQEPLDSGQAKPANLPTVYSGLLFELSELIAEAITRDIGTATVATEPGD